MALERVSSRMRRHVIPSFATLGPSRSAMTSATRLEGRSWNGPNAATGSARASPEAGRAPGLPPSDAAKMRPARRMTNRPGTYHTARDPRVRSLDAPRPSRDRRNAPARSMPALARAERAVPPAPCGMPPAAPGSVPSGGNVIKKEPPCPGGE